MHKFFDGQKEVEIPVVLEELTPEQYKYFITLASVYASGEAMTEDALRVRWFSYLAGLGPLDFTLFLGEKRDIYRREMAMTDGFFRKSEDGRLFPDFETPANLLPVVDGYTGPKDFLEGVTFGEFTDCISTLGGLQDDGEPDVMDIYGHIARVLYKIPEENKVPDILYFHAPTLFRNVLKQIESGPIDINGSKIDFRIIFQPSGSGRGYDDKTGWAGIAFEVASSGVFGGLKDVENADLWMVLLYLYKCKFEYLHSKAKGA